ncbi:hypothetical protein SDC9_185078 [bioreactor metagenome]|uniref:Uncharacterized protein n=1 Tax=bioreactor metagenome TaxID=1076179 RepID=A0A645HEU3_9ZZZZ
MQMDEKLSEAHLCMLGVIRLPSIKAENFWPLFVRSFISYMDKCYREEGNRKFANCSLDASLRPDSTGRSLSLLGCLPDKASFESTLFIKEFFASLPQPNRDILRELMQMTPRVQIMHKYNLTRDRLRKVRKELQSAYAAWQGWVT